MVAEVTCVSKPWTIIPMVVTNVQDFIAAGQFRGGEQLIDPQQVTGRARCSCTWNRFMKVGWRG
jgi:hypothetical protein